MKNVLACIDESSWSISVQDAAIWVAGELNSPLLFLHSIEKSHQTKNPDLSGQIGLGARSKLLDEIATLDQQRAKIALQLGKELLENAKERAQQYGCEKIETVQRHGQFVESVLAQEESTRLVVIGHSGAESGEKASVLGSHVENLLRQVSTPVFITSKEFKKPTSFMLAYDGRATTEKALERILSSDLLNGLRCHLVTVKNKSADQEEKFKQAIQRLEEGGFQVNAKYLEGDIFQQLYNYQQENSVDMLVMGAFAGTRLRQFFVGSNTLKMLGSTELPVLVIK